MEKNGKEICRKNKHFFGFLNFFLYLPEFLDPKCYTGLESYGNEVSHGKMLKIFGVTIWLAEFCQHFGIQIITSAVTAVSTILSLGHQYAGKIQVMTLCKSEGE